MLVIRQVQLDQMQAAMDQSYYHHLHVYFRENYSKETQKWDDHILLEIIVKSVKRARQLGVKSAEAMLRYVGLAVLVNPNFDNDPKVSAFFDAPDFDPDYKVHLLSDMLIEQLRNY